MNKYISKSALAAEFNRVIAELVEEGEDTMFEQGRISAFEDAKLFIDTLEVKEVQEEPVSEDLEEEINCYYDKIVYDGFDYPSCADIAKHFAQWQREQIEEVLLSEVLPCFMHGGEADEVVAKLDEVLNFQKK